MDKDIKVMSIGGNCMDLAYTGDLRVKGPVDNIQFNQGLFSCVMLFQGSMLDYLNNNPYEKTPRTPTFEKDSDIEYRFKKYSIVHNNWESDHYKSQLADRLKIFNEYYNEFRTNKNLWFCYSLSQKDVSQLQEIKENFYKGLEFLRTLDILDRVVFVGNKRIGPPGKSSIFNYYSDDFYKIKDIHYIQLEGCKITDTVKPIVQADFKNNLEKIIKSQESR